MDYLGFVITSNFLKNPQPGNDIAFHRIFPFCRNLCIPKHWKLFAFWSTLETYNGGFWCSLVCNQKTSDISPLIFLCGILIVSNQCFIVVYYGLSLIAVRDSLRILKISDEYVIKKRWLRGLLSHVRIWCSLVLNHHFMVVYLQFIFNCCVRHPTHTKISIIKNVDGIWY